MSDLAYTIILKKPPEPGFEKGYILQVVNGVYGNSFILRVPVQLEVTEKVDDVTHIATVAKMYPLKDGIDIDIDKVTWRSFTDINDCRGTIIECRQ